MPPAGGSVVERTHHVASTTFTLPQRFSDLKAIGKGSYGVVVAALDEGQGKRVAIKKITPMAKHTTDAKHILREIRIMRHMGTHENILSLEDLIVRDAADELYIVMELLDSDLHRVLQSKQTLTENHFRFFTFQLLCGLKHLHRHRIIHRDLKPGNLLVTRDCKLRITDFGLARERPTGKGVDPEDQIVDPMTEHVVTRWYRPPELMLCPDGLYTYAVDLWSVGCIFAEMLGRKPLFPGKNFVQQLSLIFDAIGSPSPQQVAHIKNAQARKFLEGQQSKASRPFSFYFPEASEEALSLLAALLVFSPAERLTVDEALRGSFLSDVGAGSPSLVFPTVTGCEFEFERNNASKHQLKALILLEASSLRATKGAGAGGGTPSSTPRPVSATSGTTSAAAPAAAAAPAQPSAAPKPQQQQQQQRSGAVASASAAAPVNKATVGAGRRPSSSAATSSSAASSAAAAAAGAGGLPRRLGAGTAAQRPAASAPAVRPSASSSSVMGAGSAARAPPQAHAQAQVRAVGAGAAGRYQTGAGLYDDDYDDDDDDSVLDAEDDEDEDMDAAFQNLAALRVASSKAPPVHLHAPAPAAAVGRPKPRSATAVRSAPAAPVVVAAAVPAKPRSTSAPTYLNKPTARRTSSGAPAAGKPAAGAAAGAAARNPSTAALAWSEEQSARAWLSAAAAADSALNVNSPPRPSSHVQTRVESVRRLDVSAAAASKQAMHNLQHSPRRTAIKQPLPTRRASVAPAPALVPASGVRAGSRTSSATQRPGLIVKR